ncbi:hypothetical protein PHMEG_00032970 [Phytophthora megakarya]|uniref:CCHC-type domain-containing protein n=1 Tax=Phytophthora megakarya TaxID=4795 RepID=A0A225UVB6_9STRA|nr:hypothetical protein PHMEG_00032970 [Phytophthora megakarya]
MATGNDGERGETRTGAVPRSEIAPLTTAVTHLAKLMEEIKSSTEGRPRTTTQATETAVADETQHRRHVVVEGTGISRGSSKEVARLHPTSRRGKAPAHRRAQRTEDPEYPPLQTPATMTAGDDEPDENSNDEGGGSDDSSSGSEMENDGSQEMRVQRPREQQEKDLELPTFVPSPKVSVSTWIDRVDLSLKGVEESGRGRWSDKALYYILGNKLMENASTWWVNRNRSTPDREKTWTHLKKALLQRYVEKLDRLQAEWRVSMRRFLPGESYADFAADLREVVGRHRVSERVVLAQFYRCLDKMTKQLVKQDPRPTTLEAAVRKANDVDDPMENVALGMMNVGLPWATALSPYVIPMAGTTGQTMIIPGIGNTGLPAGMHYHGSENTTVQKSDVEHVTLFTNPQGVYNVYSGTWDTHLDTSGTGSTTERKRKATETTTRETTEPKTAAKRPRRDKTPSDDESDARAPRRQKVAIRQVTVVEETAGVTKQVTGKKPTGNGASTQLRSVNDQRCFKCGQSGHWAAYCTHQPQGYACKLPGHLARDCTNPEAKARHEELLKRRGASRSSEEN